MHQKNFLYILRAILPGKPTGCICCPAANLFKKPNSSSYSTMATLEECKAIWREADAVMFDVDSTVVKDEGLDELAEFCGLGQQVKDLTNKAMGGSVTFRTSLEQRLNLLKPSYQQVSDFRKSHKILFSDGIPELVSLLHERGTAVFLVSGGFRSIIEPIAEKLEIPLKNIYANRLSFFYDGQYAGFDKNAPTSSSGGKTKVAEQLKQMYKKVVAIGDGVTDMEACPPADLFIGYGGNVVREKVQKEAPWFVKDINVLIDVLRNDKN